MKKLIFTILISISLIGLNRAMAQNGRNNNSDFKVPLPVVAPPLDPNFGFNIVVPTMPALTVPGGMIPSLTTVNYLPQIPSAPLMPLAPESNLLQSVRGEITESNYPKTIKLPPLAPIPSNPQVRLTIY